MHKRMALQEQSQSLREIGKRTSGRLVDACFKTSKMYVE